MGARPAEDEEEEAEEAEGCSDGPAEPARLAASARRGRAGGTEPELLLPELLLALRAIAPDTLAYAPPAPSLSIRTASCLSIPVSPPTCPPSVPLLSMCPCSWPVPPAPCTTEDGSTALYREPWEDEEDRWRIAPPPVVDWLRLRPAWSGVTPETSPLEL